MAMPLNSQPSCPFAPPVPTFMFESRPVRVLDRNGDPWFAAADVCSVLGIANSRDVVSRLDEDEKGVGEVDTLGGKQSLAIISEPGLYALVGRSRKPEAKRFDRWVRHEVLPTIRRTGSYSAAPALPDFSDPKVLRTMLLQSIDAAIDLQGQVAALAPKADALDVLVATDEMILITDGAKRLGIQPKELFAYLRENAWIYRRSGSKRDIGHEAKIRQGLLVHKYNPVPQDDGTTIYKEQVHLTRKGLAKLAQLLGRKVAS